MTYVHAFDKEQHVLGDVVGVVCDGDPDCGPRSSDRRLANDPSSSDHVVTAVGTVEVELVIPNEMCTFPVADP